MKAVVVRNENFELIGFEVSQNNSTLFSWGISPVIELYYIKEVSIEKNASIIFELVKTQGELNEAVKFQKQFFDILNSNEISPKGKGVNMEQMQFNIASLKAKMEKLILTIK